MNDFSVETHPVDDRHAVITVAGELDLSNHQQLRRAVAAAVDSGRCDIVIDLSDTRFLDSAALGTLIGARRQTYARGGSFEILCRDPSLLRLFAITSLDRVFRIRSV
jgi:anti-sigma B factor antagonist